MSTQQVERQPLLSAQVAANIRAEAARRGWSQGRVALAMGMSRIAVSDRYRGKTPWTLDEMQKAAHLFGVPLSELYAMRDLNPQPADSGSTRPLLTLLDGGLEDGRPAYGPLALWGRVGAALTAVGH